MSVGRVLLLVFGSIATLLGIALLAGGGTLLWVDTKRDEDGFFTTSTEQFQTSSYALASEDLDIASDAPGWLFGSGRFGDVRLTGTGADPTGEIFIGIAEDSEVAAYLTDVEHDLVTDVDYDPFAAAYSRQPGATAPAPPSTGTFWEASVQGSGTQTLEWGLESGTWAVVVMNADASPGIDVEMSFGANIGFVFGLGVGLLAGGGVLLLGGIAMIYFGARRRAAKPPVEPGGGGASAGSGDGGRGGGEASDPPADASDGATETRGE